MRDPQPSRSSSPPGTPTPSTAWEFALFSALHAAQDRAEFARALAAAVVHPDALGADVAHVLRRDPLTDVFERTARVPAPESAVALAEWFRGDAAVTREKLALAGDVVRTALDLRDKLDQLERRTGQAGALLELSAAAMSPKNLAEVLHLATRLAADRAGADAAAIWAVGADGTPSLQLTHGPSGARERHGRALTPVVQAAVEAGRPRIASPATDEMLLPAATAAEIAALAIWPIEAYGRPIGALGVWTVHGGTRRLSLGRAEREYLGAAANLVGLTLDQSRRFAELRTAERRERDAARYAQRRDSLASLGEISARASEEALKPVASVRAFANRLLKELPEGVSREYAEVILRETGRLERILREQRAHAELAPPTLALVQLNTLADEALRASGEALVRRRARVIKRLATDLPELLLDAEGIGGVVKSVLAFALDSVSTGGRIRLETRRLPQHVLFELGHDGAHSPGEALDQLFLPFGNGRPSGLGTGLSLARRVIQDHGGEIRVRSEGEWTTLVTFTLPIVGNQDRRRTPADRRRSRDRRQGAAAA
jgi:nitrogen-specific signal transduction histidine kinase